eukprot:scaffold808_cov370-Prasinococcus_capsulatus_cf.AAC.11
MAVVNRACRVCYHATARCSYELADAALRLRTCESVNGVGGSIVTVQVGRPVEHAETLEEAPAAQSFKGTSGNGHVGELQCDEHGAIYGEALPVRAVGGRVQEGRPPQHSLDELRSLFDLPQLVPWAAACGDEMTRELVDSLHIVCGLRMTSLRLAKQTGASDGTH